MSQILGVRKLSRAQKGGLSSYLETLDWLAWPEAGDWNHLESSSFTSGTWGWMAWRLGSAGMVEQRAHTRPCHVAWVSHTWTGFWEGGSKSRLSKRPHESPWLETLLQKSHSVLFATWIGWRSHSLPDWKRGDTDAVPWRQEWQRHCDTFFKYHSGQGYHLIFFPTRMLTTKVTRCKWMEECHCSEYL